MCIIIDANIAGDFFKRSSEPDIKPIHDWIEKGDGKLVFGGRNMREIYRVELARKLVTAWQKAGKAYEENETAVDAEEIIVDAMPIISDDPHVLALARISNVRTLFSDDRALGTDFKNTDIVPKPKGKVYKNSTHTRLLTHTAGCPGSRNKTPRR